MKEIDFKQIKSYSDNNPNRAILSKVKFERNRDEFPDLSLLNQFENSSDPEYIKYYEQDQKRKHDYYKGYWHMIGIRAKATIHIPIGMGSFHMVEIESGGLWGIESDSGEEYFREVEQDELHQLLGELEILNVFIPSEFSLESVCET